MTKKTTCPPKNINTVRISNILWLNIFPKDVILTYRLLRAKWNNTKSALTHKRIELKKLAVKCSGWHNKITYWWAALKDLGTDKHKLPNVRVFASNGYQRLHSTRVGQGRWLWMRCTELTYSCTTSYTMYFQPADIKTSDNTPWCFFHQGVHHSFVQGQVVLLQVNHILQMQIPVILYDARKQLVKMATKGMTSLSR